MQLNFLINNEYPDLSNYLSNQELTIEGSKEFRRLIKAFYKKHGRVFAWRNPPHDPYHIVVSEIMLQQTQTDRVKSKFEAFINEFPNFSALAHATTENLMRCWQGLGYNRRALALRLLAQRVMDEYSGIMPDDPKVLSTFKGIGVATAGSICAFAFNKPTLFIETNIRAVYIYTFFQNHHDVVDDGLLLPLIEATLDHQNPRTWYYALMDYGVALKKNVPNPNRKSKQYTKQSPFEGSDRQLRGRILRLLTAHMTLTFDLFCSLLKDDPKRIKHNLTNLCTEGFITGLRNTFKLR